MIEFVLFFVYFLSLLTFSIVTHPIFYCGLLVLNSLVSSAICYYFFGFRWYSLLFCLVYVGGVYILFVFVSVFSPKNSTFYSFNFIFIIGLVFLCCFIGLVLFPWSNLKYEFSFNICRMMEGWFYLCMCFTLVFGFFILRLIMNVKFKFYR